MKRALILSLLIFNGCKHDNVNAQPNLDHKHKPQHKNEPHPEPEPRHEHIVMLIDRGIDPHNNVFKDKIIATYTLACKSINEYEDIPAGNLKNELESRDSFIFGRECKLSEGIQSHPIDIPEHIQTLRKEWNSYINGKSFAGPELEEVKDFLKSISSQSHGTQTGSLIAYKNPKVKFVLIEKKSIRKKRALDCAGLERKIPFWSAFAEEAVQKLIIKKGILSEWRILDEIAKKHHVTLVNKSYGRDRKSIEDLIKEKHCDTKLIDPMSQYFTNIRTIEEEIAKKEGLFYDDNKYLTFRASGNSGLDTNSKKEDYDCTHSRHFLSVGSYDIPHTRSKFSNYGKCVDLYAVGSDIVTSYIGNFLKVGKGTSYSSPLALRYASLEFSPSKSPSEIRAELLNHLDSDLFLPYDRHFDHAIFNPKKGSGLASHPYDLKPSIEDEPLESSPLDLSIPISR